MKDRMAPACLPTVSGLVGEVEPGRRWWEPDADAHDNHARRGPSPANCRCSDRVRDELARREGLLAGQTPAADVVAARRLAAQLGTGRRVVMILVGTGVKYLTGDLPPPLD
jgi:hypothetical protein